MNYYAQMLNCISGMVEKTQRAISILQQRQAEAANVRSAEELVADIQSKASHASNTRHNTQSQPNNSPHSKVKKSLWL